MSQAPSETLSESAAPELTVIVVSYNTRALTLKCLETLYANTHRARFHTVVLDNDSKDGSAEAIAQAFPQVELIASRENLGFAKANNVVAEAATTDWLLLLNPDTEVHANAIDNLLEFAKAHPKAGITGGRTVFPDGSLNAASCWMKITPWSAFCMATGLTALLRNSALFNPEGIGGWQRDTVRAVDIVQGCFLMIPRKLWRELGGFDLKYFMYGEEADMCLRAAKMGYGPMMTPDAQIMHLMGASAATRSSKQIMVARARMTLITDHWPAPLHPLGRGLMWLWGGIRRAGSAVLGSVSPEKHAARAQIWKEVWEARHTWLRGY